MESKTASLSKSRYCRFWQCPKMAWLNEYKPELCVIDEATEARFAAGNEVGDLAMGLFGDFVEVTAYSDGRLDLAEMIRRTEAEMAKGTQVICEASFSFQRMYCAVDILRREADGWAIYEVKSSTHPDNPVYAADVAYQKYVLENCGLHVTGTYLVCLNSDYIRGKELDVQELFRITDISSAVALESVNIAENLRLAALTLADPDEPGVGLSMGCTKPYACGFWQYCARELPSPSVFELYNLHFDKKLDDYHSGIVSFEDLLSCGKIKNKTQLRQIDFALHDRGTFADKGKIKEFLSTLSYPLYFLDFETMQPAVPPYCGTKPYAQIPFQYSLHYIEHEGGELLHKEFLAESGPDPRRAVAERLCTDIPKDVCVTAFNMSFERGRIRDLAAAFPDLADHLLNIESNIKDLLIPFRSGWYYNRAMGGSFSIKSVLPALFPDDPSLNYHNLEGVHNGNEAMTVFPRIKDMAPDEQRTARHNLLKYCELDTFAMVKVWEALVRASE